VTHLALDPVTRVGGQLRVELELDSGTVSDAWVCGTGYRGLERILEGRDGRDAWLLAERICGTGGLAHAVTSVRAVEHALGVTAPANARLLRNILAGTQLIAEEVAAFYLRQAWDWVDVRSALTASPNAASTLAQSLSAWPNASASYFDSIRGRLAAIVNSDQPGPFAAMTGHPAYRLPAEANLLVAAHYFDALDWRRKVLGIETVLGGKTPHLQTLLVGGMAISTDWGGPSRPVQGEHLWDVVRNSISPLGAAGLAAVARDIEDARTFVEEVFLPDVLNTMLAYTDQAKVGSGIGHYLAFGEFPADGSDRPVLVLPRGRVMDRDTSHLIEVGPSGIAETTAHAWYAPEAGGDDLRDPSTGVTVPRYGGPKPPFDALAGRDRYSWVKAPRYEDDPMEVGPLARLLVGFTAGDATIQAALGNALSTLGLRPDGLFGTVGRIVARAVEASVVAGRLGGWLSDLRDNMASGEIAMADLTTWDPASWPAEARGYAMGESAQGAIGHWVTIRDGRIATYQIVDGTTWNASPRDGDGRRGALEAALVGTSLADAGRPLELLRTIHSFDPCLSCGVH
jgi:Ni,Fe-hydrogenase I large subunit